MSSTYAAYYHHQFDYRQPQFAHHPSQLIYQPPQYHRLQPIYQPPHHPIGSLDMQQSYPQDRHFYPQHHPYQARQPTCWDPPWMRTQQSSSTYDQSPPHPPCCWDPPVHRTVRQRTSWDLPNQHLDQPPPPHSPYLAYGESTYQGSDPNNPDLMTSSWVSPHTRQPPCWEPPLTAAVSQPPQPCQLSCGPPTSPHHSTTAPLPSAAAVPPPVAISPPCSPAVSGAEEELLEDEPPQSDYTLTQPILDYLLAALAVFETRLETMDRHLDNLQPLAQSEPDPPYGLRDYGLTELGPHRTAATNTLGPQPYSGYSVEMNGKSEICNIDLFAKICEDQEVDQSGITGDDVAKNMEEVLYNVEEEHCDKQDCVLSMDSKLKIEAEEAIDCDASNSYTENVSSLVTSLPNDNHATEKNRDVSPEDQRLSSPKEISPPSSLDRIDTQLTMLLPVAALMPVMKGDFRVVLQQNAQDMLEIYLECCDSSMAQLVEMHLMYVIVLDKVSLGAVFTPMKVVKIFISGGQVKHFGYESRRVGHVVRFHGCCTLGAYSSLRLQRITRRRRAKELEFGQEENLGLLHLDLHISEPEVCEWRRSTIRRMFDPGGDTSLKRSLPTVFVAS